MYLNKAILIGNLTRDPELKSLPSGIKVCSFSIATNRVWKDKNGARQESADYHNVVVFGRQAETRSWDDKNSGEKKYRTEVIADRTQFGPKSGGSSMSSESPSSSKSSTPAEDMDVVDYPEEDINPEDIPF